MKILSIAVALLLPLCVFAQRPNSPEEQEKQLREAIDKEVDRYIEMLDLEDWQAFYVDSILTYNYGQRMAEINKLAEAKVSNMDLVYQVSDKWVEATYVAFQGVFDEDQWAKYLKQGGAKEKKLRDKRAAKLNQK